MRYKPERSRLSGMQLLTLTIAVLFLSHSVFAAEGPNWIEQFGIRWTFEEGKTYQYGQFINGDYWVVGPVNIISIDPPSTNVAGVIKNGSMLNPVAADDQAYDSRAPGYNAGKNMALDVDSGSPLTITAASSLISCISLPGQVGKVWIEQAAVLTILEEVPPANSFRPPYSGSDKSIRAVKDDYVDNPYNYIHWNKLNSFPKPAESLSYPALVNRLQMNKGPWINHWESWWERYIHPDQNMPDYGRGISERTGEAALALNLNYTKEEKEPILINFLQLAIDLYGVIEAGDISNWINNGGHMQGRKIPILFAGIVLQNENMKSIGEKSGDYLYFSVDDNGYPNPTGPSNPPSDYIHFQEDDQTFYVTQYDYNVTHNLVPGTPWAPDSRTSQFPYRTTDIGMPEWGIRHATHPGMSARNLNTNYRSLNSTTYPAMVLAAHIMGMKEYWNHDALFDYTDRWVAWVWGDPPDPPQDDEVSETQARLDALKKAPQTWVWNAWNAYRANYGPVWPNQSGNLRPTANAGSNRTITDDDGDGIEQVSLDGSASTDDDGIIASWSWTDSLGDPIPDGEEVAATLRVGEHIITLTVTDDAGASDIDTVAISIVNSNLDQTYYVSENGSGSRNGLDWNNAYAQLPANLERGYIYYISDGRYDGYTFNDPENDEKFIYIKKAVHTDHGTSAGWLPEYGDGIAEFGPLTFESDDYIFDGQHKYGFKVVGEYTGRTIDLNSDYVFILNSDIDGNFQTDANGYHIDGSCSVIYIYGSHVTLENCDIHNAADDGIGVYGNNITIKGSEVHNLHAYGTDRGTGPCFNGHSDAFELQNCADIEIIGNLVYDIKSTSALITGQWSAGNYTRNLTLYNNIFYTPDIGVSVYIYYVQGAKIYNNVFWGRTQSGGLLIGPEVTDLYVQNNIIVSINYNHLRGVYDPSNHHIDYNLFGRIPASEYTANAHDIVGDPLFKDIPRSSDRSAHLTNVVIDNFALQSNSPAINRGMDLSAQVQETSDIVGTPRLQGEWDIGSFEYIGAPTADAGVDQTVIDVDGNGSELITLNGANSSDPDGTIQTYVWREDSVQVASGINPTVTLSSGTHTITLTVTDNLGASDTDTVTISIEDSGGPVDPDENLVYSTTTPSSHNGIDSFVQIPTSGMNAGGGTIALSAYAEDLSVSRYLFGHTVGVGSWSNRIQLYIRDGNLGLGLGDTNSRHRDIASLQTLRWYHVALTWNGSSYAVYVDGSESATGTYSGLTQLNDFADIGNTGNPSFRDQEAFSGVIDDVRIYNRALTAAEIQQLYNIGSDDPTHSVTASAQAGGSISPNGTLQLAEGVDQTFTITPATGYNITDVIVDGSSVGTGGSYTFANITGDHTIIATFALTQVTHTIQASAGTGGSISPSGTTTVNQGQSQQFTITPATGYHITDVLADGSSIGDVGSHTFANITGDHTISATFSLNTYAILAIAHAGATVSPSGVIEVQHGSSQAFTIAAQTGYYITDVIVDGQSMGAIGSYTFTNITQSYPLVANAAANPGPAAWWKLDTYSGLNTLDSSGNDNTATLANGPSWTGAGELELDGIDDHVDCGSGASSNLTGDLTVTAWVCPDSFGAGPLAGGLGRIVDRHGDMSGFAFYVKEEIQGIAYLTYGGNFVDSNSLVIDLAQWQHVAVTYSDASDTVTFYVNGQPAGGGNYQTNPNDSANAPLIIGNRATSDRGFEGMLSDVRIYSRTLADDEISAIYRTYEVIEAKNLGFEVSATDSDGNVLSYVVQDAGTLPAGATFTDSIFTWLPWYNQAGSYEITFEVPGQPGLTQSVPMVVENVTLVPWYRSWLSNSQVNKY